MQLRAIGCASCRRKAWTEYPRENGIENSVRLGPSHSKGLCHQTVRVNPTPTKGQRLASISFVLETGNINENEPRSMPTAKMR